MGRVSTTTRLGRYSSSFKESLRRSGTSFCVDAVSGLNAANDNFELGIRQSRSSCVGSSMPGVVPLIFGIRAVDNAEGPNMVGSWLIAGVVKDLPPASRRTIMHTWARDRIDYYTITICT